MSTNRSTRSAVSRVVRNGARRFKRAIRRSFGRLTRRRTIESYVRSHSIRKLQIGSGPNPLEGWLNSDIRPRRGERVLLDATKPFPVDDQTFDYVYSEHMIEHLTFDQAMSMLQESFRILRPGGRIRVATPNLETIMNLATTPWTELQRDYIEFITNRFLDPSWGYRASFAINAQYEVFGHRFLFDPETLEMAAREAGFDGISWWEPGKSSDLHLIGVESHSKVVGDAMNRFTTMVLEAERA